MGGSPVRDRRDRGAARAQVARGQLAHLAGADEQHGAACEVTEDLLCERGSGGRHRSWAFADRGLDPGAAACVQCLPEEAVEQRARSAPPRTRHAPGRGSRPRPERASRGLRRRGTGVVRRCRHRAGRGQGRARPVGAGELEQRCARARVEVSPRPRSRGRARCGCRSRGRPPRSPAPRAPVRAGRALGIHGDALPQLDGCLAVRDADESESRGEVGQGEDDATSANPRRAGPRTGGRAGPARGGGRGRSHRAPRSRA